MDPRTRANAKPTETHRYWPHFAQGWSGNVADPVRCARCGFGAYVGRPASDPTLAEVAHVDPTRATWDGNVVILCRACNAYVGKRTMPVVGLERTPAAVASSIAYVEGRRAEQRAERGRRAAAGWR